MKKSYINKKYIIPILIAFTLVFIILIINIFFVNYMKKLISDSVLKSLKEITSQDAEKLENRIKEHVRIMETILNEMQQENVKDEQEIFEIYDRNSGKDEFSRIAILYEDGKTVTSDGKTVDLSEDVEEFFSIEEIKISKSRISKVDEEEINIYSKKIDFLGKNIVVLLVIDNTKYENMFTQNIYNGNAIECIINTDGTIIANSKNEKNGGNIFDDLKKVNENEQNKIDKLYGEIQQKEEGQISYLIQGHIYYISYKILDVEEWRLIIIVPGNIMADELNQLAEIITIISIIITLLAFIITIYILISKIKKEEELYKLAYIDTITNLGNYNYYLKALEETESEKKTIIILDINKFKTFNKKYGHIKGNELLKNVGEELKKIIRKKDIVCRLGNDVFGIIILEEVDSDAIAKRINEKITKIKLGNSFYNIQISIGIYICEKNEKNAQDILDKAIIAHESVKGIYNVNYGKYTQALEQKMINQSEIENIMIEALKNEEFEVYYQPQVSLKTGKVESAEALVRWKREGKMISPIEFIPLFEKNLFITKLDEYIYESVCKYLKDLKKEIINCSKISVNLSKETIQEKNFVKKYMEITDKYNINPNDLELEITERTTSSEENIREILTKIKEKGFDIAIDDFGTGYSSLNMLETMPIDTLKIDKSFIDKIDTAKNENKIIEIIMMISQELKLKTIAEGVENIEQINYLKSVNCDLVQGYFYSKPLNQKDFKIYVKNANK